MNEELNNIAPQPEENTNIEPVVEQPTETTNTEVTAPNVDDSQVNNNVSEVITEAPVNEIPQEEVQTVNVVGVPTVDIANEPIQTEVPKKKGSKKLIVLILILAIICAGTTYWYLSKPDDEDSEPPQIQEALPNEDEIIDESKYISVNKVTYELNEKEITISYGFRNEDYSYKSVEETINTYMSYLDLYVGNKLVHTFAYHTSEDKNKVPTLTQEAFKELIKTIKDTVTNEEYFVFLIQTCQTNFLELIDEVKPLIVTQDGTELIEIDTAYQPGGSYWEKDETGNLYHKPYLIENDTIYYLEDPFVSEEVDHCEKTNKVSIKVSNGKVVKEIVDRIEYDGAGMAC